MMKNTRTHEKPGDNGRASLGLATGLALAGAGLAVGVAAGQNLFSGESPAEQRQVQTLQAAKKMYSGTLLISPGAKFRTDNVVANNDRYDSTPDNIRLTVPENKTIILTKPVEINDDAGDLWVGMIPEESKPDADLRDVAHATGWVNLTELRRQGMVEELVDPRAEAVSISLTEQGKVQDDQSHEVYADAMHSYEVPTAEVTKKLGELGIPRTDVPTAY